MSTERSHGEKENCTASDENCTGAETVQEGLSLKEKIFFVCNKIENSGLKITRALVREETGGSDRDLSRYINEWKESKGLAVRQEGKVEVSTNPDTQESGYSGTPNSDLEAIARRGAERAAALIVGEEAVMYHLLENPDRLPEDLRQQVEAYRQHNNQRVERRQEQYKPDFFAERAIAQFS